MVNEDETKSEPPVEATPPPEQPTATTEAPSTEPMPDAPPSERAPVAAAAPAAVAEGGPDGGPDRGGPADRRGGRRHFGRRRVCTFCIDKARSIDYKDPGKLRRYLSDRARIEPRRKTGTCAKHQRWLAEALKRARHLALLPYTPEHIRVSGMFASRR